MSLPAKTLGQYLREVGSDSPDVQNFLYTKKHFRSDYMDVGDYTYGMPHLQYPWPGVKLIMGKFCAMAVNVRFYLGGNHNTDAVSTYPFPLLMSDYPKAASIPHPASKGNIVVGNDVWFGENAIILSGVTIGDGAVIGLGSVVTKDVPPYSIVAGNPARVRKMRFDDDVIAELLRIKWWDWPIERIKEHADLIAGSDPWKLIEVARKYE